VEMDLRETRFVGVDWLRQARDRYRWWAVVNVIMNLRVIYKVSNSAE
jgi:hypothetical protein